MKIVVHGSIGGYRLLYATPRAPQIARDVCKIVNNEQVIGESAYSLAFMANGNVFTKYVFVRDSLRNFATGTMAISLYLTADEKSERKNVKAILDELLQYYCDRYIKNYNTNRGETDRIINEDWQFIKKYESNVLNGDSKNLQSGTTDAAFVYYDDINGKYKLQEYFDEPYQEEYSDFKQVFFIEKRFENKPENPLNALRHSGIELTNIDLENKYYYLYNYDSSKGVTITRLFEDGTSETLSDCIRAKWQIHIEYLKDKRCYKPIKADGTLFNRDSKIYEYLNTRDNQIIIDYDAFNNPTPIEKTVFFEIKDQKGESVKFAEIQIGSNPWKKVNENPYKHIFKGKELIEDCIVCAKKDDFFGKLDFNPKDVEEEKTKDLFLEKTKHISMENKNLQNQKKYWIDAGSHGKKEKEKGYPDYILSKNSFDIDKNCIKPDKGYLLTGWKLQNSNDNEYAGIFIAQYRKEESKLDPRLKALGIIIVILVIVFICVNRPWSKPDEKTPISLDKTITEYVEGNQRILSKLNSYKTSWEHQEPKIKETGGGILGLFGFGEKQKDSTDYKKWYEVLKKIDEAIDVRKMIDEKNFLKLKEDKRYFSLPQEFQNTIDNIDSTNYDLVRERLGNIPNLTLTKIAENIDSIIKTIIPDPNRDIIEYLEGVDLKTNILTQYKNSTKDSDIKQRIEKCMFLRNALNQGNVSQFKVLDFPYSSAQQQLKNAINDINDKNKFYVGNEMNKAAISSMNLNDIATFIQGKIGEWDTRNIRPGNLSNAESSSQSQTISTDDKTSEIIQYLKSDMLKKSELETYRTQTTNIKLINSIDLALKFWELNGMGTNSYSSYQKELQNDNNFNNSYLKSFVDSICEKAKIDKDYKPTCVISLPNSDKIKNLNKIINIIKQKDNLQ